MKGVVGRGSNFWALQLIRKSPEAQDCQAINIKGKSYFPHANMSIFTDLKPCITMYMLNQDHCILPK